MRPNAKWSVAILAGVVAAAVSCGGRQEAGRPGQQSGQPASARTASGRTAEQNAALPDGLRPIVETYRQIIILVEDERTLDPSQKERANLTGRVLYQENHQRLASLAETLGGEVATGQKACPRTAAFLDVVERSAELHDADKLVFADVLGDLDEAASVVKPGDAVGALRARLGEDRAALTQIRALYEKELDQIFGRFETRGMTVRREAWDAYVAFLRTRFRADAILKAHADRIPVLASGKPGAATDTTLETTGARLPLKSLVLTFDDGPHRRYTDQVREILERFNVKAVFFEVGQNVAAMSAAGQVRATRASSATRRLLEAGEAVANHTFSHELLPKLSDQAIADQIERTDRVLRAVPNVTATLFRPPYGARDERVMAAIGAHRLTSVLWNIDSRDWADPIPKSIANRVIQEVEGEKRGVVLFHDIHQRTVEALPLVIETLQARGYRFLSWNGSAFVDTAPPALSPPALPQARTPLYRESWAVVVGIDNYRNWPKLSHAANDARAVRDLLVRKHAFKPENVTLLLNEEATRDRILSSIGDALSDPIKVKRDDRVLVFFAGHGTTRRLPSGRALGYIVPAEADLTNYQSQAISMTNFQDISESIPAKHILFVTDACYGGLALTRGGGQNYLQEVTRRTARQLLTAGGADEQVADNGPNGHSIFSWTVMQGLEGRADLNGDGFITASELAAYVGPVVSSLSHQTPAFGSLPGSEGGEFVFELEHESEFLSDTSSQLDEEAIKLNSELDRVRAEVAAKRARNEQLQQQLQAARAELSSGSAPPPPKPASALTAGEHNDRGMVLFREKHYREAAEEFQQAVKMNPTNALFANNLGYVYYRMNDAGHAAEWFEKTLALDPRRAIAYANLGDAYLALNRKPDARKAYEKYLELQPNAKYATTVRQKLEQIRNP
jgi:peptidoglycan/xylan/chitin deacetylase (PgdA/CDA1 family)/tetratricopeptide (TPR) repeat protein